MVSQSWRDKGDKTCLIALEVRYLACNQLVQGSKGVFCFLTNQTKVQFLYYGQMTRKVNVSGILFPSYRKQKGKRITWSQVNLGTVNLCLSSGGGMVPIILGGLMQKKGSPRDFTRSPEVGISELHWSFFQGYYLLHCRRYTVAFIREEGGCLCLCKSALGICNFYAPILGRAQIGEKTCEKIIFKTF